MWLQDLFIFSFFFWEKKNQTEIKRGVLLATAKKNFGTDLVLTPFPPALVNWTSVQFRPSDRDGQTYYYPISPWLGNNRPTMIHAYIYICIYIYLT